MGIRTGGAINDLYAESATAPMFKTFQLHPYVSSRLGRTGALKEMIEYLRGREGVRFATGIDEVNNSSQTPPVSLQVNFRRLEPLEPLELLEPNRFGTA